MPKDKYILIYNKVKDILEDRKLFLNPDMSLKMLSRVIGTNTMYLSRAINQGYGESFTTVINRYRLEYLIKEAVESEECVENVFEKYGFWSRSTFYELFRQFKGMTPQRYIDKLKIDKQSIEIK